MHAIIVSIIHVSFGVSSLCCVNPYNPVFITNQTLVSSRCTLYLHIAIFELSGFFSLFSCVLIFMTYNSGQSLFSLPVRLWFFLFVLCVITLLYLSYLFLFLILVSNPVGTPWEPRSIEMGPIASSAWRGVRRLCGMYKFTTNPSFGWDVNKTEVPCWEITTLFAR
jgi:hypothetical protein